MPIANNTPLRAEQCLDDSGGHPARDARPDPSESTPDSGETKTGFFQVWLEAIDEMARHGQVEPVLAYLVLARHTKGQDIAPATPAGSLSTAGVQAITNKTGLTARTANQALEWLCQRGFIETAADARQRLGAEAVPGQFGKGTFTGHRVRWYLVPRDGIRVALANELVSGLGKGRADAPLVRLCEKADTDFKHGMTVGKAQLDALTLLIHLYHHQDLQTCGGVDPWTALCRAYCRIDTTYRRAVTFIFEDMALIEVQSHQAVADPRFALEALGYVPREHRQQRFWNAYANLKKLGLIYEVLTVWAGQPGLPEDPVPELAYTLYVHDGAARKGDPYLQPEINRTAAALGVLDGREFADNRYVGDDSFLESGRFRYICPWAKDGPDYVAVGVTRLRYRPRTPDTGRGMEWERKRVERWKATLDKLRGRKGR